jgi:hypothetical protein
VIVAGSLLLGLVSDVAGGADGCHAVAIPSYFPPGAEWDQVIAGAPTVHLAVLNPDNGVGTAPDPAHTAIVMRARQVGIRVLGYISTRYAARPVEEVIPEIESYSAWYGVADILLDETPGEEAALPYYQALVAHVRGARGGLVALNPGRVPAAAYAGLADLLIVFEGDYEAYRSFQVPDWIHTFPPERFAHLVYGVPGDAEMGDVVHRNARQHAGYLYVTDGRLPNPWSRLPGYWSGELRAIERSC